MKNGTWGNSIEKKVDISWLRQVRVKGILTPTVPRTTQDSLQLELQSPLKDSVAKRFRCHAALSTAQE
jgi:hypothetical protein